MINGYRTFPPSLRKQFWMAVSGANSYLTAYGPGYYALITTENDDEAYPIWPHPDSN